MTPTDTEIKQAREFFIRQLAKKENLPVYKSVEEVDVFFDECREKGITDTEYVHLYNTKITRAMIRELLEEVKEEPCYSSICGDGIIIDTDSLECAECDGTGKITKRVRDKESFMDELVTVLKTQDDFDLVFATLDDLLIAFHRMGE